MKESDKFFVQCLDKSRVKLLGIKTFKEKPQEKDWHFSKNKTQSGDDLSTSFLIPDCIIYIYKGKNVRQLDQALVELAAHTSGALTRAHFTNNIFDQRTNASPRFHPNWTNWTASHEQNISMCERGSISTND